MWVLASAAGIVLLLTALHQNFDQREEEREKIFEKGFRGESGSKMSGSGIGLALARDLARQVGGDLKLIVDPSKFKSSLP